ncbi:MAG: Ferrous-iron efflux pump FieF [Chlamydiae bacterium]|nr:Ferrous-iron efflux pump FieF [Chlamydiota bacterium]
MTKFPNPITLPDEVFRVRAARKQQILRATKWGIGIRLLVILFELFGFYWYSSSALLMDAIASSLDIVASIVLLICIKLAARPPDKDHPFGHGRYEPLAGLQLGLLLVLIGGGMLFQQGFKLSGVPVGEIMDPHAWIIALIATLLLEACYQFMIRVAKRQHSPALAAEALHYRIDGLTSLLATMALVCAPFIPDWSLAIDHVGAMLIACIMVGIGLQAAKSNFDQIMDRVPDSNFFARVRRASLKVSGVKDTEKIRIQLYGPDAHVDIDVEVDPQLPVEEAHLISQKVRAEIQKEWPAVRDVMVHIEPFYPNDH